MSNEFQKRMKLIDNNIKELNSNTLDLKGSLELLKTTTNLLNSANDLILSQNNNINNDTNNFLIGNNIENYYNNILKRKKEISEITERYNQQIKENKSKEEEDNINNSDNESDSLLNKNKPQVELRFIMNKNEALVSEGQKGLEEIKNDIGEIRENINKQRNELDDLDDAVNDNVMNAYNAEGIITSILNDKRKSKVLLYITNFLLLILIIIIAIYKFFK